MLTLFNTHPIAISHILTFLVEHGVKRADLFDFSCSKYFGKEVGD